MIVTCTVLSFVAGLLTLECPDKTIVVKTKSKYVVSETLKVEDLGGKKYRICKPESCKIAPPKLEQKYTKPKEVKQVLLCSGISIPIDQVSPIDIVAPGGKLENCPKEKPVRTIPQLW